MKEKERDLDESKYIQPHLANERTYLAWVRTAFAIVGIGFLTTSLHVNSETQVSKVADLTTVYISISSLLLGFLTITGATINYYRIRKHINNNSFTSSKGMILFLTFVTVFIGILVLSYYILIS
ncbi:DUF202 domain-containing protein [Bacillus timonensis]|nr:DUF202 domain-containing protein [Bacillus timonensis]